jgi:RND family efflux transporter MFP subunit
MWVGVGLPDWDAGDTAQNRPIDGKIDFVSNQLDPNTGSIRVRATFENKDGRMVAGLFARVRVPTSNEKEALLVNDLAIGTDQGQKFILVVNDRNVVESHPVEVGQMHGDLRQVYPKRAGVVVLRATDRLVVNGLQRVRPGITVKPETVDMKTLMPPSKSK